jgi:uncharacterized protein involved in exopolysaccharide biosynthesis
MSPHDILLVFLGIVVGVFLGIAIVVVNGE